MEKNIQVTRAAESLFNTCGGKLVRQALQRRNFCAQHENGNISQQSVDLNEIEKQQVNL